MREALSTGRAFTLFLIISLLAACGGGGGGSSAAPPSATLSYPSGTQTEVIGTAITPITPTITGTLSGFTVSPTLPAGLTLDASKGSISGTPTVVAAAKSYTISASTSGGAAVSAALSLAVNDVSAGKVSYGASSYTFSAKIAGLTLTPTVASGGGAIVSWSINPALPAGLNFDTTTGIISGTPSAPAAAATYVVSAQNSGGASTVSLKITVDVAPLLELGHQSAVVSLSETATNVLSTDHLANWILWDYASGSVIASGNSGCLQSPCSALAGSTAVVSTNTGLEIRAASDGHVLGTITMSPRPVRWHLATDGSYITAGSTTGLSAWSTTGQLLFSISGDYSQATAFAAPGAIRVIGGPAGTNVLQTITVPGGTASTSAPFNGTFYSWFLDGSAFITAAGSIALIYSSSGVQQGSIQTTGGGFGGEGNWVWASLSTGALGLFPATGASTQPSVTFTGTSAPFTSGLTVGASSSGGLSIIDLSTATPTKTDYSVPFNIIGSNSEVLFAAASGTQWMVPNGDALFDGASAGGTARYFGVGRVSSIAGGTGYFAVSTPLKGILYFNSTTLAQLGQISAQATQMELSGDGTVLAVLNNPGNGTGGALQIYSLPTAQLQYTWPSVPGGIFLSTSGTMLGQDFGSIDLTSVTAQEASAPTGGTPIFYHSTPSGPGMAISPDGTLIATSTSTEAYPTSTSLMLNGNVVTGFNGVAEGWLDNSRLVVANFGGDHVGGTYYKSCSIYNASGTLTGNACALPQLISPGQTTNQLQPVSTDLVFLPNLNQIFSVSTGAVSWSSGDADNSDGFVGIMQGSLAGSHIVFVSGTKLVAQSY